MASQDWLEKDFYKILGVSKDATEKDIKSAYRKLARKHHPDSNQGDTAAEDRFKEISEAHSVLGDPKQREEYDQIRALGAGGARFTGAGGPGAGTTGGFEDIFSNLFTGGGGTPGGRRSGRTGTNYENIFDLFGGGQSAGHTYSGYGGYPQDVKGNDVTATVKASFREAATGTTMRVETTSGEKVSFRIPAGVKDGQTIRVGGKGSPSPTGGKPGDMLIKINVEKHPVFTRDGNNLRVTVPITFFEATLGGTIDVPTLEGDPVKVRVPKGSSSGKTLRIKGRGIQTVKAKGDLLVTLEVVVPNNLSDSVTKALEELRADFPQDNPRDELFAQAKNS